MEGVHAADDEGDTVDALESFHFLSANSRAGLLSVEVAVLKTRTSYSVMRRDISNSRIANRVLVYKRSGRAIHEVNNDHVVIYLTKQKSTLISLPRSSE
jgi:hypothetical protein